MATDYIPKPNEKQKLFFMARARHIGYGGARGGGKSWAVRTKAKMLAARYPGIRILIVRRTYPELTENHIRILRNDLKGIAKYNSTEKSLTFTNGSLIKFAYCKNDQDLGAIQGHEYDIIFIDEAAQLSEFQMKAIAVCCRGVNAFPKRIYYTCNPGGQGHGYIKRIFIDRNFLPTEKPEDYVFVQALVDDNRALMEAQPEYVQLLDSLPYKLREAWRHGRWDVFEGQVFGEFTDDPEHYLDHKWTHVIEPFDVPETWTIYRGYDHGYAKPFSCGWYAISPAGRMYRIRELYGCTGEADVGVEWDVPQIAAKIREIERDDPNLQGRHIFGIADTAIFKSESGPSIAEQFEEQQVYFDKADKHRLPGKMQCHFRLAFDEDGLPMFYVFNTCKHFIRTIPALIYSETDVEDVDTKTEDHIYDEWRYICMNFLIPARAKSTKETWTPPPDDPLNMMSDDDGEVYDMDPYDYIQLFG